MTMNDWEERKDELTHALARQFQAEGIDMAHDAAWDLADKVAEKIEGAMTQFVRGWSFSFGREGESLRLHCTVSTELLIDRAGEIHASC
jgi:hypothetical protein